MKKGNIEMELKIAFAEFDNATEILKSLAHPIRLCIVQELTKTKLLSVKDIQQNLSLPQPIISLQLAKLKNAGIVDYKRDGGYKFHYLLTDCKFHFSHD